MQPVDLVIAFVILLILVVVISAAAAIITRVPFVPTPRVVSDGMIRLARLHGTEHVYDLGAGTGSILRRVQKHHPNVRATGFELSPVVLFLGRMMTKFSGTTVELRLQNALLADVRDAEAIFLYMTPEVMRKMEGKFDRELRPGTVVISHAFTFPRKAIAEQVAVPYGSRPVKIFRYIW